MKLLHIGEGLSLPVDTVTSTLVVYGGKGMGKTNLAAVLGEELSKAGLRFSWLDPLGVAWGLRHSQDGKGPGVQCVILGGVHGDIPIEPTAGAVIADMVVDEHANFIIDFSRRPNGEMWLISEKIRFVTDYTLRLFQRQGGLVDGHRREPIYQILDEAARYIPQTIPHGAEALAKCVSAWETLVEEGRNVGIGIGLFTQRSARMAKSVSEVADAMFSFRIVGPNSIKAVTDWLGEHVPKSEIGKHIETLRALPRGHCLVVSPGWLHFEAVTPIRMRETFDSSATPKPGERARRVSGKGAMPDLAKYQERMKATIERVKADDPKELKRRIAELERAKPQPVTAAKSVSRVDLKPLQQRVASLGKGMEAAMKIIAEITAKGFEGTAITQEDIAAALQKASGEITKMVEASLGRRNREFEELKTRAQRLLDRLQQLAANEDISVQLNVTKNDPFTVQQTSTRPAGPRLVPTKTNGNGSSSLPPGERAVLVAAGQFGNVDRDQLSVLTGYKRSSRDAYIARLQARGYIEVTGREITPTQEGVNALGSDYEPLPVGDELRDYWLQKLPEGERRILEVLMEHGGNAVSRDVLDERTGYKRSSRDAYLARLGSRRLVEALGRGEVKASANLFA